MKVQGSWDPGGLTRHFPLETLPDPLAQLCTQPALHTDRHSIAPNSLTPSGPVVFCKENRQYISTK